MKTRTVAATPRRSFVSATPSSPVVIGRTSGLERGTSDASVAAYLRRRDVAATGWRSLLACFCLLLSVLCFPASAQTYSIDWHKIAGGGGTSTGGVYSVSGTIGQPDACGAMSGGNYSVTGGFWALIQVMQTPGAPALYISGSGSNVTVYWQDVVGWNLIQSGNLTTPIGNWSASSSPTLTNGTNYVNIVNPTGNLFFRLKKP